MQNINHKINYIFSYNYSWVRNDYNIDMDGQEKIVSATG